MEEKEVTAEEKADFEARKKMAIAEVDAALTRNQVGIQLGITGLPYKLQPVIIYSDLKEHGKEESKPTKEKKSKGK